MIIKISSSDHGTWNLIAKERDDDTSPWIYTAHGRSAWAIRALVHGILTDHAPEHPSTPTDREDA